MSTKIILDSTVTVLAVPQFFPHPKYELPDGGTASERLIAHGGKGCYDSYGKDGRSIDQHVQSLVSSGHGSCLEHANVSLFIEGISRGCSHELVRHRAGMAYSQRSTRYTAEGDAAMVLEPWYVDQYRKDPASVAHLIAHFKQSSELYQREVERLMAQAPPTMTATERRKWSRGKARQLLPHSLETRMTMTGNLRAWRHFLEARSHAAAEAEIRRLAAHIYDALVPLAPLVFQDYVAEEVNGYPQFSTTFKKV